MGAEITYQCLSGNTYRVSLSFYRDCEGITPLNTISIFVNSATCSQSLTLSATLQPGYPVEVSPLCPAQLPFSECKPSGTLPGVQRYLYQGTITLPSQCRDWILSFSEGYRNNSITTLNKPGSTFLYVQSRLNNLDVSCNSSPVFSNIPTPFVCINEPYLYNHGATDPEGDSLVYRLVNCLNAANQPVTYLPGFSGANPLSSLPAVGINAFNGNVSMRPTALQVGVMAVVVEEYRNGILIGSVTRDMQVTVLPCNNAPPVIGAVANLVGGVLVGPQSIEICANTPISFTIPGTDADVSNGLLMGALNLPPGATFTASGNNPVTGTFTWNPTLANVGANSFVITLRDDACPIFGSSALSLDIVVRDGVSAGSDRTICVPGATPIQLQAVGGTQFSWRVLSGSANSLSCTNCQSPTVNPQITTFYEVSSNLPCDPRDTIRVAVSPGFQMSLTSDTVLCTGGSVPLQATPWAFGTFSYQWNPSTGLSNPNIANPVATPPGNGITYRVLTTSSNGCTRLDSVRVGVSNNQLTAFPAAASMQYCAGYPVNLSANVVGANCSNYNAQNIPFSPVNGIGASVVLGDEQVSTALPIGFSFRFYCNDYTNFYLSSNGWLSFGTAPTDPDWSCDPIPSTLAPNNMIALTWTDLNPGMGGSINYFTVGTAPNRQLVVNFTNVPHYNCNNCLVTTQLVLYEGSNVIEFHNTRIQNINASNRMTQGIENASGAVGVPVPGRNYAHWTALNDAWRFSLTPPPGTYTVQWQAPLGNTVATGDNATVTPQQPTTYYAVVRDNTGSCESATPLNVNVAYVDAGPDRTIFLGSSAQIDGSYFGPPPAGNCNSYSVTQIPHGAIAWNGTALTIPVDGISSVVFLPFQFTFFCNTFNQLRVAEDGFISFTAGAGSYLSNTIPNGTAPNAIIAGAWDDLKQRNFSRIAYFIHGAAPNRRFVVRYQRMVHYTLIGGSNELTFEIHLLEGSNIVEIHSTDIDSDGGPYTVQGIENADGTAGYAVAGRNRSAWSVSVPEGRRFTPTPSALNYSWSPPNWLNNSNLEDPVSTPPSDQTYVLTVNNGSCILRDSMRVFILPLPVRWLKLEAVPQGEYVAVDWITAEERDSDYFVVERSADGIAFHEIGQVEAAGHSDAALAYAFTDVSPVLGRNYYRIRLLNLDGSSTFSDVVEVWMDAPGQHELLAAYPNPAKDVINLRVALAQETPCQLALFDLQGRVVLQQALPASAAGVHTWNLRLDALSPGLYTLRLAFNNRSIEQKISLIR